MNKQSKLITIFKEPLVHFLLIGGVLFYIYSQMSNTNIEDKNEIHITKKQIDELASYWYKSKGRVASKDEKQQQIDKLIQEEVLYREALAKGLEKDDATIHLHLAKKMQYIFDDLSVIQKPTDEQLKKFLSQNESLFMKDASISFNQVVFTYKDDSQDVENETKAFLKRLKASKSPKVSTIGDFVELSKKSITKAFSKEFADLAFSLPLNGWQEPIKTKHGIHLIYIHSRIQESLPEFSQIKEKVYIEWRQIKRAEANKSFYKKLYKNYKIIID